jgi:cytidylate kinase
MTVVAIDGPAGAGKSSVGRAVARALWYSYLDTGALYRAVALAALERGIDPNDDDALARLAAALDIETEGDRVRIDGRDVTEQLRDAKVNSTVSNVSAHRGVRRALLRRQQEMAEQGRIVMEGRDIGVTVAPKADVKIFLTASLSERAERRALEMGVGGDDSRIGDVEQGLAARDAADGTRAASPLVRAPGALLVDSTDLTFDEVVRKVIEEVHRVADES